MNLKYANFDFDKWLCYFFHLREHLLLNEQKFKEVIDKWDCEELEEWKENFYNQNHHYLNNGEHNEWCNCSEYLSLLNDFNSFMSLLMSNHIEIFDIVKHCVKLYNEKITSKTAETITKSLLKGYSYNTRVFGKEDVLFTPDLVKNIKYILNAIGYYNNL